MIDAGFCDAPRIFRLSNLTALALCSCITGIGRGALYVGKILMERYLCVLLQMAKVKVYVIPKSRDGPATEFCTDDAHNVRELHHLLTQAFGIGCLFSPNNLCLCPDLTLKLEDGEYKYYESHLGSEAQCFDRLQSLSIV